jgi:hypothetical protein
MRYRLQNENPAGVSIILSRSENPDGTRQQGTTNALYHLHSLNIPRRGDVVAMPARHTASKALGETLLAIFAAAFSSHNL